MRTCNQKRDLTDLHEIILALSIEQCLHNFCLKQSARFLKSFPCDASTCMPLYREFVMLLLRRAVPGPNVLKSLHTLKGSATTRAEASGIASPRIIDKEPYHAEGHTYITPDGRLALC
jgi:hypothetical protein